jgi:hypothetical protein
VQSAMSTKILSMFDRIPLLSGRVCHFAALYSGRTAQVLRGGCGRVTHAV